MKNLKENTEEFMGEFGREKEKGEMMQLYYNLKNKNKNKNFKGLGTK